jgi:hypothetical protein
MAKKKSNTEEHETIDANKLTDLEIFEIVVSNFGHVQHNQIEELFKILNSKK